MKLESEKKDADGHTLGGLAPAIRAFGESMDFILKGQDDVCEYFIGV